MRYELWEVTNENIELAAVQTAVDFIMSNDMVNFFRFTSYIDIECFDGFVRELLWQIIQRQTDVFLAKCTKACKKRLGL